MVLRCGDELLTDSGSADCDSLNSEDDLLCRLSVLRVRPGIIDV